MGRLLLEHGGGTSSSNSNKSGSEIADGTTLASFDVDLLTLLILDLTFSVLLSNLIPYSFFQWDSISGLPALGLTVSKKASCCT
jgi:hypothetical protein